MLAFAAERMMDLGIEAGNGCAGRRASGRPGRPPQRLPRTQLGRARAADRAGDPLLTEGRLFSERPGTAPDGGEGVGGGGANMLGKREVLGVASGSSEAEPFWKSFLRSLAGRGLRGVKLVISDDRKRLRSAAGKAFNANQQRCRVHWMRNALAHVGPKRRPAFIAMLKTIFAQERADAAYDRWRHVVDALRERYEKPSIMMDGSREEVLAYMAFPKEHWAQISSTNLFERVNEEIKRRADVVSIFPNTAAVVRLVGALMLERKDEWPVSRR